MTLSSDIKVLIPPETQINGFTLFTANCVAFPAYSNALFCFARSENTEQALRAVFAIAPSYFAASWKTPAVCPRVTAPRPISPSSVFFAFLNAKKLDATALNTIMHLSTLHLYKVFLFIKIAYF